MGQIHAFLAFAGLCLAGGVCGYFGWTAPATWLATAGGLGMFGMACYSFGGHNAERRITKRWH